ncbi:uncharacterized protein EV420DRAFT_1109224 [Desarmillaria tabescens]|uniref:Uncharacterized protein n=1 Tax=Armillaria tabescens TaxID=1929756 RepID=A0AA39NDT3_ARMTA|nr:uncharacterized protein EV420DRAFT_1109224 [Desarmillaria tabescens]KAK0463807.1 hypothetical protein EV420DRAFT_1109224 [Desarmillaria tabescens]
MVLWYCSALVAAKITHPLSMESIYDTSAGYHTGLLQDISVARTDTCLQIVKAACDLWWRQVSICPKRGINQHISSGRCFLNYNLFFSEMKDAISGPTRIVSLLHARNILL